MVIAIPVLKGTNVNANSTTETPFDYAQGMLRHGELKIKSNGKYKEAENQKN